MENLCNNCIHKDVCSRWTATWGMKTCEHFKEERKGKWLKYDDSEFRYCSNCGHPTANEKSVSWSNWCPLCGADMRGTEDG